MPKSSQLELFTKRKRLCGAPPLGRRVRPERVGFVPHVTRPQHDARHPMHLTIRRVAMAPSFRKQAVHRAIVAVIASGKSRGIRVIQYSIQDDHLHLMVEGGDRAELAKKLRFLFSRIALSVNRLVGRRGALFRDRYHRHDLATPREVRNALRYVLFNTRKHATRHDSLDAMSSAPWFAKWHADRPPDAGIVARARAHWPPGSPVSEATTWLARIGWLRAGGPLRFDEMPTRRY